MELYTALSPARAFNSKIIWIRKKDRAESGVRIYRIEIRIEKMLLEMRFESVKDVEVLLGDFI